ASPVRRSTPLTDSAQHHFWGIRPLPSKRKAQSGMSSGNVKRVGQCLLLALLNSSSVWSLNEDFTLQRLNHRAYTIAEGAPAQVNALAQTPDGTLWAGGETGLTRFDGLHFVQYPGPADPPLPSSNISALLASADGGLWIGFRLGGVCFLRNGRITHY